MRATARNTSVDEIATVDGDETHGNDRGFDLELGERTRGGAKLRLTPEKGRPPPGGEEAEVVVYQPRGVGLIHTRHKPSNAHYTHADTTQRKSWFPMKSPRDLECCSDLRMADWDN